MRNVQSRESHEFGAGQKLGEGMEIATQNLEVQQLIEHQNP